MHCLIYFNINISAVLYQDILPLAIKKSEGSSVLSKGKQSAPKAEAVEKDAVEKCTVTLSLNPATGLVCVSEQKGMLVSDRSKEYWFYVQIISSILLLLLLLSSPFLYNYFMERSVKAEHIKWLRDFYTMHAPEVSDITHLTNYL